MVALPNWLRRSESARIHLPADDPCRSSGPGFRARGQALILILISLVVLILGLLVVFDTGQVVTTKVELVNSADAAAYSIAVQQARDFNLIAYMNRATVANQIAMAQMASWYSWTNFAVSATSHLKEALDALGVILSETGVGEVLLEAAQDLQSAQRTLQSLRDGENQFFSIAAGAVAALDGVYSRASVLAAHAQLVDAPALAMEVVHLNDPQATLPAGAQALLVKDAVTAGRYLTRYRIFGGAGSCGPRGYRGGCGKGRDTNGVNRLLNVVMEARDPFSRVRNGSLLPLPWPWHGSLLVKRGGTDLVGYRNWVGVDTLDVRMPYISFGWLGPEFKVKDLPAAWGGGAVVDRQSGSFASLALKDKGWNGPFKGAADYAGQGYESPYGGAMANSVVKKALYDSDDPWVVSKSTYLGGTVGLPDYDDIVPNRATVPYVVTGSAVQNGGAQPDVGPTFTVLIVQPIDTVRTSSHVQGIGGPPDLKTTDEAVGNGLTAIASAQVYFSRSSTLFPRMVESDRREIGSLFSPYWQARLVDTPCAVRQWIALSYGTLAPCT